MKEEYQEFDINYLFFRLFRSFDIDLFFNPLNTSYDGFNNFFKVLNNCGICIYFEDLEVDNKNNIYKYHNITIYKDQYQLLKILTGIGFLHIYFTEHHQVKTDRILELPDNLTIESDLILRNTKIKHMPKNLTCLNLHLNNCDISFVPNCTVVENKIYVPGGGNKFNAVWIPEHLEEKISKLTNLYAETAFIYIYKELSIRDAENNPITCDQYKDYKIYSEPKILRYRKYISK